MHGPQMLLLLVLRNSPTKKWHHQPSDVWALTCDTSNSNIDARTGIIQRMPVAAGGVIRWEVLATGVDIGRERHSLRNTWSGYWWTLCRDGHRFGSCLPC